MSDSKVPLRVRDLHQARPDEEYRLMTPSERLALMWQLALDAWAFNGSTDDTRLQRHVARVYRRPDQPSSPDSTI